jgi:hypothetical protein
LAQGSSHSRTRLYRRYLTIFFDFIDQEFILYGELNGKIERFQKGSDYRAFLISKKENHVKGKSYKGSINIEN